jgi:2-desacetyl-2-hydroxyethyl bacteriochlorophyllide A dehydrogenase
MATENTARAFWVRAPGEGELREAALPALGRDEVRVRTRFSAVSRGTETLVFRGEVPESLHAEMRAPFQEGAFPAPVKYGYINVGTVEAVGADADPALLGRNVFCLYPHQDAYQVPAKSVRVLPDALPAGRAVLAANLETAVNGVWDAEVSLGDRVLVVGAGVVGLLAAWLCARMPGTEVIVVDPNEARASQAQQLGAVWHPDVSAASAGSASAGRPFDVAIHASGNPAGLAAALPALGDEATLVELSWYGTRSVQLALGEHFHPRRLRLISSQVGQLPPSKRPRWSYDRRFETVARLLEDAALDALITDESPFERLPQVMAELATPGAALHTLCHRITYP